jgi:hypothetical protein
MSRTPLLLSSSFPCNRAGFLAPYRFLSVPPAPFIFSVVHPSCVFFLRFRLELTVKRLVRVGASTDRRRSLVLQVWGASAIRIRSTCVRGGEASCTKMDPLLVPSQLETQLGKCKTVRSSDFYKSREKTPAVRGFSAAGCSATTT